MSTLRLTGLAAGTLTGGGVTALMAMSAAEITAFALIGAALGALLVPARRSSETTTQEDMT